MGYWHRKYLGHVLHDGLVHYLYEWSKDERNNWDTQCGIGWGTRDNTSLENKPPVVDGPVTCMKCLDAQSKIGASYG